jgi:hypothetical protein
VCEDSTLTVVQRHTSRKANCEVREAQGLIWLDLCTWRQDGVESEGLGKDRHRLGDPVHESADRCRCD